MPELKPQTTVEKWYLVDIIDDEETVHGSVVWGIVVEDKKRRFQPGHYVCSTLIIDRPEDGFFQTQNTLYRGIGEGSQVQLHFKYFQDLRAGYSPDDIHGMNNLPPGFTRVL